MKQFLDPNALQKVKDFHTLFRSPVVVSPAIPSSDRCALRVSLLQEEVQELADAIQQDDLVEIADALADIQYVLSGAVLEFGMGGCFKDLFDEVQRSNMSKACKTHDEALLTQQHYKETKDTQSYIQQVSETQWLVYRKGDDKALKSIHYSPANLPPILKSATAATQKASTTSASTTTANKENNNNNNNSQSQSNNLNKNTFFPLVMPQTLSSVAQFHTLFRCPVVESPSIPSADRCALRVSLLQEEVQELADAIQQDDLVEVADALADIQYVLSGAVLEFGMGGCFKNLFDEVHRSNMSKACKTQDEAESTRKHYQLNKATESFTQQVSDTQWLVYRQGDHKALKSINYSPANLRDIIV